MNESDPDLDQFQQLALLRSMTERTGILHEAQVLNLKSWAYFIDPEIRPDFEINLDIEGKRIVYNLKVDCPRPKVIKKSSKMVRSWIHQLLGPWKVIIKINGKTV